MPPRPGGKSCYEWSNGKGHGFYITGELLELKPYSRIVHMERVHLPDPIPGSHIETRFDANGAGTRLTMRITLPNSATREQMLNSGMEHGLEASYARLETTTG